MKITETKIPEIKIIQPEVYEDERGSFFESFNQKAFNDYVKKDVKFVQDNQSFSKYAVLRGLHYQSEPYSQGKLVSVAFGEVYDVAVDIRKNSSTYGLWIAEKLSDKNKKQLWIPEGFAHGFLTLSDKAIFCYKTTSYYNKSSEKTINYKNFNIDWPTLNRPYILSDKDNIL